MSHPANGKGSHCHPRIVDNSRLFMGYYEIAINECVNNSIVLYQNITVGGQDLWILIQSPFRRVSIQCRLSLKLKISHASRKLRKNVVGKQSKKKLSRQKKRFCPCPFYNRPFPSYLVPLFQNESSCKTFHTKLSLIYMKLNLQSEHIFVGMASWHRGKLQLGNGLFGHLWCGSRIFI